jgi:hypothetical protein
LATRLLIPDGKEFPSWQIPDSGTAMLKSSHQALKERLFVTSIRLKAKSA